MHKEAGFSFHKAGQWTNQRRACVLATALTALTNWHGSEFSASGGSFCSLAAAKNSRWRKNHTDSDYQERLYWLSTARCDFFFSSLFFPSLDDSICWFSSICHPPCIQNTTMACDLSQCHWQLSASLLPPARLSEAAATNLLALGWRLFFERPDSDFTECEKEGRRQKINGRDYTQSTQRAKQRERQNEASQGTRAKRKGERAPLSITS